MVDASRISRLTPTDRTDDDRTTTTDDRLDRLLALLSPEE
jgi:hypothetical protein